MLLILKYKIILPIAKQIESNTQGAERKYSGVIRNGSRRRIVRKNANTRNMATTVSSKWMAAHDQIVTVTRTSVQPHQSHGLMKRVWESVCKSDNTIPTHYALNATLSIIFTKLRNLQRKIYEQMLCERNSQREREGERQKVWNFLNKWSLNEIAQRARERERENQMLENRISSDEFAIFIIGCETSIRETKKEQ